MKTLAGLLSTLIVSCAAVFASGSDARPSETAHLVRVPNGGGVNSCGSSTAIAPSWLVTNAHVVEGATGPPTIDGERPGVVRIVAPHADLALIEVPGADYAFAELGPDPRPGQDVVGIGFPHAGPLRERPARVLTVGRFHQNNVPIVESSFHSWNGDSGGGVFDATTGELVAVTWGNDGDPELGNGHAQGTPASAVRWLTQQCPGYSCPPRRAVSRPPIATRPEPRPPASPTLPTAPTTDPRVDALLARIEALELRPPAGPAGAPGPAGPKGDRGDVGPPGPPGRAADCPPPAETPALDAAALDAAIREQLRKKLRVTITRN